MANVKDLWIEGTICAPHTPMKPNGDVNNDILDKYVDFLVNNKIVGVFVLGTLGEGNSLTVEERKESAEAWVRACKNKLKYVIMHIGTGNLRSSKELARHAEGLGVTAISCVTPTYHKPQSVDALVDYMAEVAAAAPKTPFYYYDINFVTGLYLCNREFFEKAEKRIPTLRGMKHSSPELPSMLDCKNCCGGKYQILVGSDDQHITTLSLGLEVPIINGYMGPVFDRMRSAFRKGDIDTARKEQNYAREIFNITARNGGLALGSKAIMGMLGLDLGPVRLPQKPITDAQKESLRRELKAIGFL